MSPTQGFPEPIYGTFAVPAGRAPTYACPCGFGCETAKEIDAHAESCGVLNPEAATMACPHCLATLVPAGKRPDCFWCPTTDCPQFQCWRYQPSLVCDCFDPECGYPHGANRLGRLSLGFTREDITTLQCYMDEACGSNHDACGDDHADIRSIIHRIAVLLPSEPTR